MTSRKTRRFWARNGDSASVVSNSERSAASVFYGLSFSQEYAMSTKKLFRLRLRVLMGGGGVFYLLASILALALFAACHQLDDNKKVEFSSFTITDNRSPADISYAGTTSTSTPTMTLSPFKGLGIAVTAFLSDGTTITFAGTNATNLPAGWTTTGVDPRNFGSASVIIFIHGTKAGSVPIYVVPVQ